MSKTIRYLEDALKCDQEKRYALAMLNFNAACQTAITEIPDKAAAIREQAELYRHKHFAGTSLA